MWVVDAALCGMDMLGEPGEQSATGREAKVERGAAATGAHAATRGCRLGRARNLSSDIGRMPSKLPPSERPGKLLSSSEMLLGRALAR